MNKSAPNLFNINNSAKLSNLEYIFLINLFYNELIFGLFFIIAALQNPLTYNSILAGNPIFLFFYLYRSGIGKMMQDFEHLCYFMKYQYYILKKLFVK